LAIARSLPRRRFDSVEAIGLAAVAAGFIAVRVHSTVVLAARSSGALAAEFGSVVAPQMKLWVGSAKTPEPPSDG
jgi:hypothetical protein